MRYELILKSKGDIYKHPRLYPENQLDFLIQYAKKRRGKIVDRKTGEIIHNFCPENEV